MNKFTPSDNIINKEILVILDDLILNNKGIHIHLSEIALILKFAFKQNRVHIKLDGKNRNIITYIKHRHKSLSNYIKTNTKYKIIDSTLISSS